MKLRRIFGRHYCPACGTKMAVFRHPTRYRCPKPHLHGAIESDQRRQAGRGIKRTGNWKNAAKAREAKKKRK
jgi:hypothetical protein